MENAIVNIVAQGLNRDDWEGLLYVMGWGDLPSFRPLYVGKAGKRGVKNPISANIKNIATDKSKFARWGDGLDYHIGDLSHSLFQWSAYRPPQEKYEKWAEMLFVDRALLRLREKVNLVLIPWYSASIGPSGNHLTLEEAESEAIAVAASEFKETLLNHKGENWKRPASSKTVKTPRIGNDKPIQLIKNFAALNAIVTDLEKCEFIGLDVETCMRTQRLCLIQIATEQFVVIIDPLAISDISPLNRIFASPRIIKIIHNASFERRILKGVGLCLENIFDTLSESRRARGKREDGHSLAVVAKRELNKEIDKTLQTSDWTRRPLNKGQIVYAALDADILIDLFKVFKSFTTERML